MKRLKVFLLIALLTLAAVLLGGQRALERTLNAQLPPLLTDQLGIRVSLGPIRTELRTLTAHSPRLAMGDPTKPALVATDVSVSLAWHELLRGEIRLVKASAGDLMLQPSLWPSSDSPLPENYNFLEPYLPAHLELTTGRYVAGDDAYPVSHVQWQRHAERASLEWQETQSGVNIELAAELSSLPELLQLTRAELQLNLQAGDDKASKVAVQLDLQPGKSSGYALIATAKTNGMSAQLTTGNTSAWELPQHSTIHAKKLELAKLQTLADAYSDSSKGKDPTEARLAAALPQLDLPLHSGNITIDEIRWENELITDSTVNFSTGPEGVQISSLSAQGPTGKLLAKGAIDNSTSGWKVRFVADITAAQASQGLTYLDADWLWHSGHAKLAGEGKSWGSLLDSLEGKLSLAGSHRGETDTPMTVQAMLDGGTNQFTLDSIDIKIGDGHITGSAALSGDQQRRLSGNITAKDLNLDFLQAAPDQAAKPGIAMPEFFGALPGIELDWKLDISSLTVSDVVITHASTSFVRRSGHGKFIAHATGGGGGTLDLKIDSTYLPDKPTDVTLQAEFARFDIPRLFRQTPGIVDSRASGVIKFSSQGKGVDQVFRRMQGEANLDFDIRPDHDWQRAPQTSEQIHLSGKAALVVNDKRIAGIQITQLAVDSFEQNLTGNLSLVDGRKPWLIADLESDGLDIPSLMEFKSSASASATEPETDPLMSLRKLGNARLNLQADSLLIETLAMKEVVLQVSASPENISVEQFDFSVATGGLKSRGGLSWKEGEAALSVDVRVLALDLDALLSDTPSPIDAPVSGTVILNSKGRTVPQLLAGLTGDIQLHTSSPQASASNTGRREVSMTARNTATGMRAVIHSFKWGNTDITGSVEYHDSTPPLLEVEVTGGSVSLLELADTDSESKAAADKKSEGSTVSKAAMASVGFMGDVVRAPFKFLSGTREAKPGEKLFSTSPLPFTWLAQQQATIKGRLDTLSSKEGKATDLTFSLELLDGQLSARTDAGTLNHGTGSLKLDLDLTAQPATAALTATFKDLRGDLVKSNSSRSGYFDLASHGHTQAELAANLSGFAYLELGPGPLDYTKLMLVTADVATGVFRTLIPGADKKTPQLQCGVALSVFKDGMGVTPYGYAARTDLANLVGKIEIDLKKELIHMNFSSSSRKGIGISVGNVFSNTVEVEGPLSDPEIVPNTTGLLWRGWAAVMTGGLSVVGESMLKRALASENPCLEVQKHIHKKFCPGNPAAAASAMVCPPA